MQIIKSIQYRIYEIRDERVMLDFDLAELYEVATKVLNQAVKRNSKRFPEDFMFRLTSSEWKGMKPNMALTSNELSQRSQIVTFEEKWKYSKYLPYTFTEQGIAMLSGILNSDRAIQMNISIMRAFVETRRLAFQEIDFKKQLQDIREVLGAHDSQFNQIYETIENLLDEKATHKKWNDRERIGFK
jgi:hypothetical protein